MILHFFPNSVFTKDYVEQISNLFSSENHYYIIYGAENDKFDSDLLSRRDIMRITKNTKYKHKLNEVLHKSKLIIVHSLSMRMDLLLLLTSRREYLRKIFPIFWGGDLYGWNDIKVIKKNFKQIIKFRIRDYYRNKLLLNVKNVGFLTPQDYTFYKSVYNISVKYFEVNYSSEFLDQSIFLFTNTFFQNSNECKIRNIMIGHSGDKSLNHMKVLEKMFNLKGEYDIHLPLAYGNSNYINIIENKSNMLFKNRCHVHKEFLTMYDYIKFLSKMDILIFDSNRQIAIGNISLAFLLGKVLCFRKDTPNYGFFHDYLGLDIIEVEEFYCIKNTSERINQIDFIKNRRIIMEYLGVERFVSDWSRIFKLSDTENVVIIKNN